LERYLLPIDVPNAQSSNLWLLKAGCFDSEYSRKVNTMPWEALYYRAPGFFRALADRFAAGFDYVLIDSRTGLTDISGVCTMLFPEKLVTVFTPNRQSLEGVLDLVTRAIEYRQRSDDLRPLVVFPLPSRIDNNETDLRHRWRKDPILGYEPQFERL